MTPSWPDTDALEISPEAVDGLRKTAAEFLLIDCREADEWQVCRIEGAELLPLSEFGVRARERFTGEQRPAVIYCHHGRRSAQAAHFLRKCGVERVWSMAGGIDAWSEEIDPAVPRY